MANLGRDHYLDEQGLQTFVNEFETNVIAEEYSSSATYAVDAYCTHDNKLYRCVTAISTAEVWNSAHWTLVLISDELKSKKSGTVTSVTIKGTSPIVSSSESAITTSGTRTISHANSGVTAGTYKSVTVNATGHVTEGTNPTTLSGYGITDAKIESNTVTLGSNSIQIPTITDTYSGTSSDGMSGKAVKSAIDALDGGTIGTPSASKTLTALSQTNGNISATFGDIAIANTQVSGLGTASTKDVPASGNASSTQVVMGNDTRLTDSRTPTSHSHGNITNGGALQANDATIANGDKLVITDASSSDRIARASISFDGSTTTKALTPKGTFETFLQSHQTVTDNNPTLAWGTKSKVATIGGTAINVTMPANPNTDTTYTFTNGGTNKFTVTPKGGTAQDVTFTASDSTKLPLTGGTLTGNLTIKVTSTHDNNSPSRITFQAVDSTNSTTSTGTISAYDGGSSGSNLVIHPGGNMFLGSGEAAYNHYNSAYTHSATERMFITSDEDILFQANGQTIANRVGFRLTAAGNIIPEKADTDTNNIGGIGSSTYKWANGYFTNINGVAVGNSPEFTDTTYTFANGTNGFTVTPAGGTAQTVTVTPSITNNVTGSGTNGYIAKFNGAHTITDGPAFGSATTTYLRNDGSWATPIDTKVNQILGTDNNNRPLLMSSGSINNTTATIDDGTIRNNSIYANPSNGMITATMLNATDGVRVGSNATGGGLALWSTNSANYGITMRTTGTESGELGKHGYVQGDYATYLCMNTTASTPNRGWIFRHARLGENVASINATDGNAVFNGSVTIGGNSTNTSGCRLEFDPSVQAVNFVFV